MKAGEGEGQKNECLERKIIPESSGMIGARYLEVCVAINSVSSLSSIRLISASYNLEDELTTSLLRCEIKLSQLDFRERSRDMGHNIRDLKSHRGSES